MVKAIHGQHHADQDQTTLVQALVELFQSNSFITHRVQDGGKCIFVLDAGLDTDAFAFDKQVPFTIPPKLDIAAAKNFIEAIENVYPLPADMI